MAIYKQDIVDIDLNSGTIFRSFLNRAIGTGDNKADKFGVRVFRDGEPVTLSGVSVQGYFMPPQGDPIAITSGNEVSGNTALVVLPQACYNYEGQFCLAIKLVSSVEGVTGTVRIVDGVVDNTHTGGAVAPTETIPTYSEILAQYDAMVEATEDAEETVAGLVQDVEDEMDKWFVDTRNLYDPSAKSGSRYVDISTGDLVQSGDYDASDFIPVVASARYTVSTTTPNASANGTRFAFYTSGKVFISGSGVENEWTAQAPANAAYMRLSIYKNRENVQCERGSTATPYVPYGKQLNPALPLEEPDARFGYGTDVKRGSNLAPSLSEWTSEDGATYDSVNGRWSLDGGESIQTDVEVVSGQLYYIYWTLEAESIHYTQHMPNLFMVSLGNVTTGVFYAPDSTNRCVLKAAFGAAGTVGDQTLKLQMAETADGQIKDARIQPYTQTADILLELNQAYVRAFRNNLAIGGGLEKSMSDCNTAYGQDAQKEMNAGQNNTAIGYKAQEACEAGSYNTACGNRAQNALKSGMYNVGVGQLAQYNLTDGCWNNAMGNEAQRDLTTGCNNVSLGRRAHNSLTTGSNNTAVGAQAGYANLDDDNTDNRTTTGSYQTTIGFNATQKSDSFAQFDWVTALGAFARAGEKATAIGAKTKALGAGSVAIGMDSSGNGAQATANNQIAIGTGSHSIVLAGHKINFNDDGTVTWEALS